MMLDERERSELQDEDRLIEDGVSDTDDSSSENEAEVSQIEAFEEEGAGIAAKE